MSDSSHTFALSQDFVARAHARWHVTVAIGGTLILSAIFALVAMDFHVRGGLEFYFVAVIVMAAAATLSAPMTRALNEPRLEVGPTYLQQEVGAGKVAIPWDTISKVRVRVNPRGEPYLIQVFAVRGRPLQLIGFASMGDIVALIQNHVAPTVRFITIRERTSRQHPLFSVLVMILVTAVALALVFSMRRWGDLALADVTYLILMMAAIARGFQVDRWSLTNPPPLPELDPILGMLLFSAVVIFILRSTGLFG